MPGKTTLMKKLREKLESMNESVIVQPEPSVTIPFINDVLQEFYKDNTRWSYPLQLMISSAQEVYMEQLRQADYDFALFDAAYSSDIYGYSHSKHKRMTMEDFYALLQIGRPFKFDFMIWIEEDPETIKNHVRNRNKDVTNDACDSEQSDLVIEDLSYIDQHLEDFEEYFPIYLNKFKGYNEDLKLITLSNLPNIYKEPEVYDNFITQLAEALKSMSAK